MTPTTAPGIRARNRAAIEAEIRVVARRHLAASSAAALSLRAIARDLDMVPSALYRYVANRDDLLTLLIIDAYGDLGDDVEAAIAALPLLADGSHGRRATFVTVARTLRRWALDHPPEYALLFGSPVPDYQAPAERTNEAGTRVYRVLLKIASRAHGIPAMPGLDDMVQRRGIEALRPLATDPDVASFGITPPVLQRVLAAWHLVQGAVTSEVFEQLGPSATLDPAAVFEATADLAATLFLGEHD